jgi:glycosyltransferase involved in cell wall biosynthesis
LEYIIIDGGSTDGTLDILKKYSDQITYWISEPDKGQSHAINKGLKLATGEVFNWLNSDDYYLPNALLTVGQYFAEYPDVNVLCGHEQHLLVDGSFASYTLTTPIFTSVEEMMAHHHITQPPTFFRLSVFKTLGALHENLGFCMDADFWLRYLAHYGKASLGSIPTVLNVFRYHDQSKSVNQRQVYLSDKFNLLLSLIDSCSPDDFPYPSSKDIKGFERYFTARYPLSKTLNRSHIKAFVAVQLIVFFKKHMTWCYFWRLYFYVLKTKLLGHSNLFYGSPLLKIRQHLRQLKT